MNKKSQRIASIAIGLVLAILLVYVGVRVVQKRQSRASAAQELTCTIQGSEGTVEYVSGNADPGEANYSTEASYNASQETPFIAQADNSPEAIEGGMYRQTIKIGPLVANTAYVVKVGDQTTVCQPSTVAEPTTSPAGGSPTPVPPTAEPTQEEVIPTTEPQSGATASTLGLSQDKVDTFYKDTPSAPIDGCTDHFKNETDVNGHYYTNIGHVCAAGWTRANQ